MGAGGAVVILQQHYASNVAWSLPELNSKLRRRGWRRGESREEGLRMGWERVRKWESVSVLQKWKKKNRLAGVKRMVDVLLFTAERKNDKFTSHTQHGTFFKAWLQNRLLLQVTSNSSLNLFLEPVNHNRWQYSATFTIELENRQEEHVFPEKSCLLLCLPPLLTQVYLNLVHILERQEEKGELGCGVCLKYASGVVVESLCFGDPCTLPDLQLCADVAIMT